MLKMAWLRFSTSLLKQSSQSASSLLGSKGTSAFFLQTRHLIQNAGCFSRSFFLYLSVQTLQRLGMFCKPLSRKNFCSPAVQTNLSPQSLHIKSLSSSSDSLIFDLPINIQPDEKIKFTPRYSHYSSFVMCCQFEANLLNCIGKYL